MHINTCACVLVYVVHVCRLPQTTDGKLMAELASVLNSM